MELKNNIRVLARIRPMIEKEHTSAATEGGSVGVWVVDEEKVALNLAPQREYEFDRVFGPSDGQQQVRALKEDRNVALLQQLPHLLHAACAARCQPLSLYPVPLARSPP